MADFNRAISLDADYFKAYVGRGRLYLQMGSVKKRLTTSAQSFVCGGDFRLTTFTRAA